MSTICSAPQKPYNFTYNQNKFTSSNNYYNMPNINGKYHHNNVIDKYPRDNKIINNFKTSHYKCDRKRQTINPIKRKPINHGYNINSSNDNPTKLIQQNQVFNKNNDYLLQSNRLTKNKEYNKNITNLTNLNNKIYIVTTQKQENINSSIIDNNYNLTNKKKNTGRVPSHISRRKIDNYNNNISLIKDIENIQNNFSAIKDDNSKIEIRPIYNNISTNVESKIKINFRNESVFSKATKNNFFYKVEQKKGKFHNGAIGLINMGNTCYFNAAIQNLKNVYLLTLYLSNYYNNFNTNEFSYKYCELISNLINQDIYQWYEPRKFFAKLVEKAPIFNLGEQNDSNYCVMYILTLLEKETKIYIGEKPFQKVEIISNYFNSEEKRIFSGFMDNFFEKKNSCIADIFYGFQENIYKCNICNYSRYNFQGFSVLNVPIIKTNNEPIYSLEESIIHYQHIQNHLNERGFSCPKCNGLNISTNALIISLPKTLIINFKRIGENNFYNHNVKIPEELKMRNLVNNEIYEYNLIGCIKHYGGGTSGHNIAICNNFFDGIWYEFNDSSVTSIWNTNHVRGNKIDFSGSFMFFYSKKNINISEQGKTSIINLSKNIK